MGYRVLDSPWKDITITTALYKISYFHQASYAWYWSCKSNFFWGTTGLFWGTILTDYEAQDMGYRLLASPLNDIPITIVLYEISHFHEVSFTACVNEIPFECRLDFPGA